MSGIIFKSVKMKNFLSVGNSFMEYNLDQKGTSAIIGKNGHGKSLLLDAICFVLYGKSYRGCNKPKLINSVNCGDSVVEIEFETMKKTYKIVRGQKPNIFEIYQNGVLLNQDAKAKDYQVYLESNILKMNFKSFTQIIVLGSTNYKPFMTLTAMDRRDVIEDLLDIQIFSKMRKVLKEFTSDNNHMIAEQEGKMKSVDDKIEMQKKHIKSIKQRDDDKTEVKREELEVTENEICQISKEITEIEIEVDVRLQTIKDQIEVSTNIRKMSDYKSRMQTKLKDYKKVERFYTSGGDCPTCEQAIDKDFANKLLEGQETKVCELSDGIEDICDEIKKCEVRMESIRLVEVEIRKLQSIISERNGRVSGLNRYVRSLNEEIIKSSDAGEDVQEYEDTLKTLEDSIDSLQDERGMMTAYKNNLKVSEMILKDNGIKSKIIKEYLPSMNQLINKYLTALDFFVEFTLDENFKETVKSRFRDEFSYESFSEGEKFRINIAILLAWRDVARMKNSSHTNILILDEVFDSSLDSEGVDEFVKLLQAVTENDVHVMVISHRGDTMLDKYDRIYKLTKTKGFTTMSMT